MSLLKLRCFLWRVAGKSVMALAFPLFAIDTAFSWLAKSVTLICALLAAPLVIFYDWCVKRHNALRSRAKEKRI